MIFYLFFADLSVCCSLLRSCFEAKPNSEGSAKNRLDYCIVKVSADLEAGWVVFWANEGSISFIGLFWGLYWCWISNITNIKANFAAAGSVTVKEYCNYNPLFLQAYCIWIKPAIFCVLVKGPCAASKPCILPLLPLCKTKYPLRKCRCLLLNQKNGDS